MIVKLSAYALESKRLRSLSECSQKARDRARAAYEREAARRGTVIAVLDDRGTVQVAWTDGRSSYCLDYMVEEV